MTMLQCKSMPPPSTVEPGFAYQPSIFSVDALPIDRNLGFPMVVGKHQRKLRGKPNVNVSRLDWTCSFNSKIFNISNERILIFS